jgi:hypothetical protein
LSKNILHPAFEDGSDRGFRNVGKTQSDAGEIPKRKYTSATLVLDSPLEWGKGSASRPGRILPPGKTRYSLYRRLGGPQGRFGQVRKISAPPGFFFFFFFFFYTIVDRFDRFDLFDLLVVRVTNMGQIILLPLPKEGRL